MCARRRFSVGLARQLQAPAGIRGLLIARRLNRNNSAMVEAAVECSRAAPGARAADVGFGGGSGLRLLLSRVAPEGHVDGVDVSATMVARAVRVFRAELEAGILTVQHGSADALPLAADSVDAMISLNTTYFLPDLARAFAEFARVLRPAGRVVIGIDDPAELAARLPLGAHGFVIRDAETVAAALTGAGLIADQQHRRGAAPHTFHLVVARRG
jgi:arsenite methyltransferase